jgi:hypothetical protein
MSWEILQVDFGVAPRGRNHAINQVAGGRGDRQQSENRERHEDDGEPGVPRRWMSKFGEETHALEFVASARIPLHQSHSPGTGCASFGKRIVAQMSARNGQPILRMFPNYIPLRC